MAPGCDRMACFLPSAPALAHVAGGSGNSVLRGGGGLLLVAPMVTPFTHPQREGLTSLQPAHTGAPSMTKAVYVYIRSGSPR